MGNSKPKRVFCLISCLFILSILFVDCNRPKARSHNGEKDLISFKPIQGIYYTEVARRMKNGLSFNEYGYQLEPQWKMAFISPDSARVYSPIKKQFINFPLSRGYDSIFNTARTWLKVKKMNKDSMIMEILNFNNDSVDVNGAKVYMRFYADNYVKNVLHTDTSILRHPSRGDTLFIKGLVAKANADYKKAFAARQPVQLISKSAAVTVKQRKTIPTIENHFDTSDDYLDPTFDIIVKNAYEDFYYSFSVYVDDKGQLYYRIPLVGFFEKQYQKSFIRKSTAIMNSYLKYYFKIIPGSTLGMPHSSIISIHIKGISAKSGQKKS